MKLEVVHRTRYEYASPVQESVNELRLQPVTNDYQTCDSFRVKVIPTVRMRHLTDFYANWVHFFEISEPHSHGSFLIGSNAMQRASRWAQGWRSCSVFSENPRNRLIRSDHLSTHFTSSFSPTPPEGLRLPRMRAS